MGQVTWLLVEWMYRALLSLISFTARMATHLLLLRAMPGTVRISWWVYKYCAQAPTALDLLIALPITTAALARAVLRDWDSD